MATYRYSLGSVIHATILLMIALLLVLHVWILNIHGVMAFSVFDTNYNNNYQVPQPQHNEHRVEHRRSRRQASVATAAVIESRLSATRSTTVNDDNDNDNDVIPTPTPTPTAAEPLVSEEAQQYHNHHHNHIQNHNNTQNHNHTQKQNHNNNFKVDVVYEDADYFVVNKPPGMVCTGGERTGGGIGGVSFHDRVKTYGLASYGYQPGLLHRLDQGTSGLMVYAKSSQAAKHFCRLQTTRGAITKQYLAVVSGAPPYHKLRGRIEGGICKSKNDLRTYIIAKGRKSGKRVLTTYKVVKALQQKTEEEEEEEEEHAPDPDQPRHKVHIIGPTTTTVLSLRLFTGRKHQIRASCRHLGCPIVGDTMYGGPRHPVMLLHAHTIMFPGINNATFYNVTVAPPPSWKEFGHSLS